MHVIDKILCQQNKFQHKRKQTFGSAFLLNVLQVSGSQTWHFKGISVRSKYKFIVNK